MPEPALLRTERLTRAFAIEKCRAALAPGFPPVPDDFGLDRELQA